MGSCSLSRAYDIGKGGMASFVLSKYLYPYLFISIRTLESMGTDLKGSINAHTHTRSLLHRVQKSAMVAKRLKESTDQRNRVNTTSPRLFYECQKAS